MKNIYKNLKVGDYVNNINEETENLICYLSDNNEITIVCITDDFYDISLDDLNKYLRIDAILSDKNVVKFKVYLPTIGWARETISLNMGELFKGNLKQIAYDKLVFNFIVVQNTTAQITHKLKCIPDYASKQRLINILSDKQNDMSSVSLYPNFSAINFGLN